MIVVVETNFVLELVFSRGKSAYCRDFMHMAETKQIDLLLPAYCMVEPYEAIIRRRKSRVQIYEAIKREIQEIRRSAHFEEEADQLAELISLLIQVGETEQSDSRTVISRLLKVASIVDLNPAILQQALILQDDLDLSPQDSVVFASVLSALSQRSGLACFITTNSKDFSTPGVAEALEPFDCKLLFDFENGINFVSNILGNKTP